jgi:hypothetical protein
MRNCLLVAATIVLTSSLASAGSKTAPTPVSLVTASVIQPLAAKERDQSKFSRARLPAAERRVRVLDEKPQQDSGGEAFYTFAIDARHGWGDEDGEASWTKSAITGCVYLSRGEVFIKRGKAFHPAAAAVGKKTKAAPEKTCQAAPGTVAQISKR